jgi:hypothetical protein
MLSMFGSVSNAPRSALQSWGADGGEVALSVRPLSEARLSWLVRSQLRRIRKRHGTGLLMHALIRTPVRSVSANKPAASVSEGGVSLRGSSSASKFPKWCRWSQGRTT